MSATTSSQRHARLSMEYRRQRLERRYRRLLTLYPAAHRAEHGAEMLGILLEGAMGSHGIRRYGQHFLDVADLIGGAARIRGRLALATVRRWWSLRSTVRDTRWNDALSVVSVVAPILLIVAALTQFDVPQAAASLVVGHPFWPVVGGGGLYVPDWALVIGAPLVLLLGVARLRRTAGLAALLTAISQLVLLPVYGTASYLSPALAFSVLLAGTAGVALLLSNGPSRGFELVRWWGAVLIGAFALVLGGLSMGGFSMGAIYTGQGMATLLPAEIAGLAGDIAIACVLGALGLACLLTPVSRRVLALLAVPLVPYAIIWQDKLAGDYTGSFSISVPADYTTLYVVPATAALAIVAGTRVARRRSSGGTARRASATA
jgi:hypothetical protein